MLKSARWTIIPTQASLLSFSVFDYGVNCVIGQTANYLWVVVGQNSQFDKSIRKGPLWTAEVANSAQRIVLHLRLFSPPFWAFLSGQVFAWIEVLEFQLLFDWIFANSIRNKFELPCQTLIWTPRSSIQTKAESKHAHHEKSKFFQQQIAECPQISFTSFTGSYLDHHQSS